VQKFLDVTFVYFCILLNDEVELPSDIKGIAYVQLDKEKTWQDKLIEEMTIAGFLKS
jgi:predicted nucleotide-binding protein